METPPPVNLNALQGILARAKSVMKKVDAEKPIALSETTNKLTAIEEREEPEYKPQPMAPGGYTREQVMASKFPPAVKEAMLKSIPKASASIILEDKSDLDDIKMIPNKRAPITKTPIRETIVSRDSDMITISKTELNEMINERLVDFLTKSYNKNLTEETIKRTINLLIKEGKLSTKK